MKSTISLTCCHLDSFLIVLTGPLCRSSTFFLAKSSITTSNVMLRGCMSTPKAEKTMMSLLHHSYIATQPSVLNWSPMWTGGAVRLRAKAYGQILARAMTVGRLLEAMDFSRSSHAMNCTCSTSFCSRHNAAYIRLWRREEWIKTRGASNRMHHTSKHTHDGNQCSCQE